MNPAACCILAIDPGTHKCGVAVVDGTGKILARRVIGVTALAPCLRELLAAHPVTHVILGDRTGARGIQSLLAPIIAPLPLIHVDEHRSSEEARRRYFREHPPRGLWRLVPLGLQVPPGPVDDLVAVILAERFLTTRAS